MNTPNKLTLLRILMVPACIACLMITGLPHRFLWTLILFCLAAVTDYVDGKLARKNNQVTDFGKFLDPLADKMLVCSILICFIDLKLAPAIAVVCIIFREFAVSSLRLVAMSSGTVIAANMWGKVKTVCQMIGIIVILLGKELEAYEVLPASFNLSAWCTGILWFIAGITVISGITYIVANRSCLKAK